MNWSKKDLIWVLLFLIIIGLGLFLRTYHFADWLHFELDQARDTRVVDEAIKGSVLDLPLLGPKAGGTFLRLGPGFYWLEYLGATFLGGSVVGNAAMIALASLLSIPIFYLFVRRFFATSMALSLTLLFSVSAFVVMYGRFAWNPNLVPFFALLGFYALLRAVDHEEMYRGRWLLVSAFAITMATHMHFLAFLALPTITVLFLLVKRPRIALKFWAGALVIVALLYLPVGLNEIATGGLNAKEFIGAISEKSTKEDHSLPEKAVRNVSEFGLHSIVILTGFEGATFPSIILSDGVIGSVCDAKCDKGKWYGLSAIIILGLSFLLLLSLWWREKELRKKDVLLLSILWFGVSFMLFLPLSYGIAPRFFLLNTPLFFILIGILLLSLQRTFTYRRIGKWITLSIVGLLVFSNLSFLFSRFNELSRAGQEAVESAPDRILKERVRVTLEQQNTIVNFFEERWKRDGMPIYMSSEPQHDRALKYLMEKRGIHNDLVSASKIYREGIYFLVIRTESDHDQALQKYRSSYTVIGKTQFGTLTALEIAPKEEAINFERQDFSVPPKEARSQAPPRYTLRQFLERDREMVLDEEEIDDEPTR